MSILSGFDHFTLSTAFNVSENFSITISFYCTFIKIVTPDAVTLTGFYTRIKGTADEATSWSNHFSIQFSNLEHMGRVFGSRASSETGSLEESCSFGGKI